MWLRTGRGSAPVLYDRAQFCNRQASRDSGFVLLIVLWSLALMTLLVAQMTSSGHVDALIARNIRGSAVAEAQADGAVEEAIFQFLTHRWLADGARHLVRGVNATAEVRIEDESGKIDPNVAPTALMAALLRICGAAPQPADRLALAIS
jgi:general secretion pathway protein K